jgi:hypothetical protein
VRFGVARVRQCGVGGEADATVGADVAAAGRSFPTVGPVNAAYGPAFGSLALMAGSRPQREGAGKNLPVVAPVPGPSLPLRRSPASHLEFAVSQVLRCGGCSYPREWNRSSFCNGTLSAGLFVHCGC